MARYLSNRGPGDIWPRRGQNRTAPGNWLVLLQGLRSFRYSLIVLVRSGSCMVWHYINTKNGHEEEKPHKLLRYSTRSQQSCVLNTLVPQRCPALLLPRRLAAQVKISNFSLKHLSFQPAIIRL